MKSTSNQSQVVVHVSDGMSQQQRFLPALKAGYFNVEELSFEQLLSMARDYARVMTYYQLDNRANGVWDFIFSVDEVVIMATILSTNLRKLEDGFEQNLLDCGSNFSPLFRDLRNARTRLGQHETASPVALAQLLDHWLLLLTSAQSNAGDELRNLIESVIRGLRQELQILGAMTQPADLSELFSPLFATVGFNRRGTPKLAATAEPTNKVQQLLRVEAVEKPEMRRAALRSVFSSLLQALSIVQAGARRLLPASMPSESHDPAVALLITFVKLYQKLQAKINHFSQNHLDFYYEKILMARPRLLTPDCVHLVMQVMAPNSDVLIARDTEFLAGLDERKQDIVYAADHAVYLNDATVTRICTLHFPSDHGVYLGGEIADGKPRPMDQRLTKAGWHNEIIAMPESEAKDRDRMPPHPLMGAPRDGQRPASVTQARFGFMLADNVLLMREGKRRITVNLQYDVQRSPTLASLESQIARFTLYRDGADDVLNVAAQKDAFFKLFGEMFSISLTSAAGWLEVPTYLPSCKLVDSAIKENCLQISFHVSSDAPAICGYSRDLHGEDFDTVLPIVRFTINPNEYQYPYDVLKHLALKEARIDIRVEGCGELLLHNNIGQLSPLAPFAPFGPLPNVGAYFVVGYAEIRAKQLSYFDVEVEWGDLPPSGMDFSKWYRGYSEPPTTKDFVANVSVLVNGKWLPNDSRTVAPVGLFRASTDPSRPGVATHRRLSCAQVVPFSRPIETHQTHGKRADFVYTPSTKNGLFKFTLAGPDNAFGHQEYPHLLSNTLTSNAKIKSPLLQKPIPKAPYTPQIASISLNYDAFSITSMDSGSERLPELMRNKLIHLHPMGWESFSRPSGNRVLQLPTYDAPGNLFIGLRASEIRQHLTLFFHLHRDSLPMPQTISAELSWHYLSENQWRPFAARQIVADTTVGFMTSGIVSLQLPSDMTRSNSVMPGDLYWIKISAENGLQNFCKLYSVYAQAVQASWRPSHHGSTEHAIFLPAGSINKARKSISGLGKVTQVCNSFNGRLAETTTHLRVRVSERLRHKNRALLPKDYESLILERFPDIYKVKCFPNLRTQFPGRVCPGHVLIVPVPYLGLDGHQHQRPRLSGHVIHEVRQFVQRLAPPLVTISVENPQYEEIQVRCTITLKAGLRGGYYSNLLNQALCEYISPWNERGYSKHFGWCVRQHDIESFIQRLEYIDHVSKFSLLRVVPHEDNFFTVDDSARRWPDSTRHKDIAPLFPWSVAVPIKRHYLFTTAEVSQIEPTVTGVSELEVGSTFIISAKD